MNTKKEYLAPTLTVVTFKSERGYASSIPSEMSFDHFSLLMVESSVNSNQESWTSEENLFGSW